MATSILKPSPSTLSASNKQEPDTFSASGTAVLKDVAWYQETLSQVRPRCRERDPEELLWDSGRRNYPPHIPSVRQSMGNKIYTNTQSKHPYPCSGLFKFIQFTAHQNSVYPEVLSRVQAGEKFLDLGCSLGQDIRKLVHEGAPAENLFGAEAEEQFIDLGYELFRDRETLKTTFYVQDFFDDTFLPDLHGEVGMIFLGNILHLFRFEKQKVIMAQLMKVLRKRKGSVVFDVHLGATDGGIFRNEGCDWDLYHRSQRTIEELFAVDENGTWAVESQLHGYAIKG